MKKCWPDHDSNYIDKKKYIQVSSTVVVTHSNNLNYEYSISAMGKTYESAKSQMIQTLRQFIVLCSHNRPFDGALLTDKPITK